MRKALLPVFLLAAVLLAGCIGARHKAFVKQEKKFTDKNVPRLIKYLENDAALPADIKEIQIQTARQQKEFVDKEAKRIEEE